MIIRTRFTSDRTRVRAVATTRSGRRVQRTYAAGAFLTAHGDSIFALDAAACQFVEEWLQNSDAMVSFDHTTRHGFAYRVVL